MRIAIVAGEASGDLLGASLIRALKQYYPDADFVGVAGPHMLKAGAKTLFPMEKLSVMGFSEVIAKLFELLSLRNQVKNVFLKNPPDVYIGIDSPDFNLPIECALKKAGIKTVHCNSPTIWAWRENRIYKIAKAVNLMLLLFPFEKAIYDKYQVPAVYIGHPLADRIPLISDKNAAREKLHLPLDKKIIALLPGSRGGEINYIGPVLLQAAKLCLARDPDLIFISPAANTKRHEQFKNQWQTLAPDLPLTIFDGQSQDVLAASDVVGLASGTAALETMLVNRPMTVVYKGSWLSYFIVRYLIKIKNVSLPNILASEKLIPEFIQHEATAENIAHSLMCYFQESSEQLTERFTKLHQELQCDASNKAAAEIKLLISK